MITEKPGERSACVLLLEALSGSDTHKLVTSSDQPRTIFKVKVRMKRDRKIFPISILYISGLKHLVLPGNKPVEHIQGSFFGHHLPLDVAKFEDVSVKVLDGTVAAVERCKHGSASRMS